MPKKITIVNEGRLNLGGDFANTEFDIHNKPSGTYNHVDGESMRKMSINNIYGNPHITVKNQAQLNVYDDDY